MVPLAWMFLPLMLALMIWHSETAFPSPPNLESSSHTIHHLTLILSSAPITFDLPFLFFLLSPSPLPCLFSRTRAEAPQGLGPGLSASSLYSSLWRHACHKVSVAIIYGMKKWMKELSARRFFIILQQFPFLHWDSCIHSEEGVLSAGDSAWTSFHVNENLP